MSKQPINQTWKNQHKKLIQATFKKGFISNVNTFSNTADVYFAENPGTVIKSISLASQIVASQLMVGDKVRVDLFDETNPNDMVIAYMWGRILNQVQKTVFKEGDFTFANGQTFPYSQAHGLVDNKGNKLVPIYMV